MRTKVIDIPLYNYQATIFFKKSRSAVEKWFAKHCEQQPSEEFYDGLFSSNTALGSTAHEAPFSAVVMHEWNSDSPHLYGVLSHELFHLAEFHFYNVGIPHSEDTSEAWAYFIGELTRQVYS